jgi:RNA polymerase-binding transcription factor DksA
MPHKMTKPTVKAGTNKVVSSSPRRSIIARATKAVANTRKAIGKVAGRPTGKPATTVVVRSAAPVRRAPTPARAMAGEGPAGRVKPAKQGGAKPVAAKKLAAKKAVPPRATARDAATKTPAAKKSAAKKVASVKVIAKKVIAKKVAGKKIAAKKVIAKKVAGKKIAAKNVIAKNVAAKKAVTRKVTAKKIVAKKAVPQKAMVPARGVKRASGASGQGASRVNRRIAVKSGATRAIARPAPVRPAVTRAAPVRPPRRGYTDERFLNHQRNVLERERATYLEQANSLQEEAELLVAEMEPGDIQFDEESGEGGTVAVDRERDLTLSAQALEAVEEINAALAKIDSGKYGVCEGCGELIPKLRLEALPYARLCMACKSGGLSRR